MNDTEKEKLKYAENNCPSVTLFTTNLTWTSFGSKEIFLGERPGTTYLSQGMGHF
jgi:hypothetical protein